jgi:peptidoglycan/LPS O-acetylase OafA/YrhL
VALEALAGTPATEGATSAEAARAGTDHSAYRPDIDGLRAVAVLSVLFFHATGVSGGYVGVDVFFVISGFLITGIVERGVRARRFRAADFYERRVRRLFPAFFLAIGSTLVVATIVLMPHDLADFGRSLAATIVFLSNFEFWRETGYFDTQSALKPLLHTWSLAVEEQFYIALPLVLIACRLLWRRRPSGPLGLALIGSLALSAWLVVHGPSADFYLPVTRAWELLLGGLISFAEPRSRPAILSTGGLVLIAASLSLYTAATPFPGVAALLPCAGAAAVLLAQGNGAGAAALRTPAMVYVGRISYPLYLWHWPILALARYYFGHVGPAGIAAALALAGVLAAATYHFVEQPVRRRRLLRSRGALFTTALAGSAVLAGVAVALVASGGAPWRLTPRAVQFDAAIADRESPACQDRDPGQVARRALCVIGARTAPSVIVWGDSQGWAFQSTLAPALAARGLAGYVATRDGCPPVVGVVRANYDPKCAPFAAAVQSLALSAHPRIVIIIGAWNFYGTPDMRGGRLSGWPAADAALRRTVSTLRRAGIGVLVFDPMPVAQAPVPRALAQEAAYGHAMNVRTTRSAFLTQPYFKTIRTLDVGRVRLWQGLCGYYCDVERGGKVLYIDTFHVSRSIAAFAQPYVAAGLSEVAGDARHRGFHERCAFDGPCG